MSEQPTRREFILGSIAYSIAALLPSALMAQTAEHSRGNFDADSTVEDVYEVG